MNSQKCPQCGGRCFAEFVDVGVGFVQVEPYSCTSCGWTESCSYASEKTCCKCKSQDYCTNKIIKPTIKNIQDNLTKDLYGITIQEAFKTNICVQCRQPALENCYSQTGRNEYKISGLCEKCFDSICM